MSLAVRLGSIWKSRRARIVIYALLAGLACGALNLLLPAEDILHGTRAALRRQPAPQDIVLVGIDDKTLKALGVDDVRRSDDAKLIDALFEAGASRVLYDRSFQSARDEADDDKLVAALKAHRGKVYLGVAPADTDGYGDALSTVPLQKFQQNSELVGISGLFHPFKLAVSFPLFSKTIEGVKPSMSAALAGITRPEQGAAPISLPNGLPPGFFRPDYAYEVESIPTISYIDVLNGKVDPGILKGKDIVVAGTAVSFRDIHEIWLHGPVAGAYFHIIAAHTWKRGVPIQLGWIPPLLLVSIVLISGMGRGRSFDRYRMAGLATVLGAGPLLLDQYGLIVDVLPAAVAAGVAVFRSRALDRVEEATEVNVTSGLPSLQSLRAAPALQPGSLIALKVRNYGAIIGSFESPVEQELAGQIARMIGVGDAGAAVYHEGDKFLWLSRLENPVDLFEHLEGLHGLVRNGLVIEGHEIDLSFNCGVDKESGSPISKRMANALQAAEQAVKDDELVSLYDPSSNEMQWEISLLSALDRAIDNGEVWVAYQPKADLKSGAVKGAEALARWNDPERGPISPDKFIRIAEEYHRIDRITKFVLYDAVRTAAIIRTRQPDFTVSVNISAQLLRFPGLPEMIFEALDAHAMGPECLVLEITETDRLDRGSKTFAMMQRLVESGLELSIDDFGTGNATIDYLRVLPAAEVKIDKVFVNDMIASEEDKLLVQSIIEMAHSLRRRVVAEGVENKEINDLLADLGCDLVQGYYISRPVAIGELSIMLAEAKVRKTG